MRVALSLLLILSYASLHHLIHGALVGEREQPDALRTVVTIFVLPVWVMVIVAIYGWVRFAYPRAIQRFLGLTLSKRHASTKTTSLSDEQLELLQSDLNVSLLQPERRLVSNKVKRWSLSRRSLLVHWVALFVVGLGTGVSFSMGRDLELGWSGCIITGLSFATFLIIGVSHLYGLLSRRSIYSVAVVLALIFGTVGLMSSSDSTGTLVVLAILLAITLYFTFFFGSAGKGAILIITLFGLPIALFIILMVSFWETNHFVLWPVNRLIYGLVHQIHYDDFHLMTLGIVLTMFVQASIFLWLALKNYDENRTSDLEIGAASGVLVLFNTLGLLWFFSIGIGMAVKSRISEGDLYLATLLMSLGVAYYLLLELFHAIPLFRTISRSKGLSLLVLRVFTRHTKTRDLFENIARQWRFFGPVYIVSGFEVAMHTMTLRSFLLFVTRRLQRLCFRIGTSPRTLLDLLAYDQFREGSFRVHDLFCDDQSWQMAFQTLLGQADRVILDLRGITAENAGMRYELEQVIREKVPGRYAILIDGTSDLQVIRSIVSGQTDRCEGKSAIPFIAIERSNLKESERICSLLKDAA